MAESLFTTTFAGYVAIVILVFLNIQNIVAYIYLVPQITDHRSNDSVEYYVDSSANFVDTTAVAELQKSTVSNMTPDFKGVTKSLCENVVDFAREDRMYFYSDTLPTDKPNYLLESLLIKAGWSPAPAFPGYRYISSAGGFVDCVKYGLTDASFPRLACTPPRALIVLAHTNIIHDQKHLELGKDLGCPTQILHLIDDTLNLFTDPRLLLPNLHRYARSLRIQTKESLIDSFSPMIPTFYDLFQKQECEKMYNLHGSSQMELSVLLGGDNKNSDELSIELMTVREGLLNSVFHPDCRPINALVIEPPSDAISIDGRDVQLTVFSSIFSNDPQVVVMSPKIALEFFGEGTGGDNFCSPGAECELADLASIVDIPNSEQVLNTVVRHIRTFLAHVHKMYFEKLKETQFGRFSVMKWYFSLNSNLIPKYEGVDLHDSPKFGSFGYILKSFTKNLIKSIGFIANSQLPVAKWRLSSFVTVLDDRWIKK